MKANQINATKNVVFLQAASKTDILFQYFSGGVALRKPKEREYRDIS